MIDLCFCYTIAARCSNIFYMKSGEIFENKILIIDLMSPELNFNLNLSNDEYKHTMNLLRGVISAN